MRWHTQHTAHYACSVNTGTMILKPPAAGEMLEPGPLDASKVPWRQRDDTGASLGFNSEG